MGDNGVHEVQLVFLLLLCFVIAFALLAKKLDTPYPIILVIAGLLLAFVPGVPRIPLDPDLIFLVVLPPLLYSAAWLTSWRDFSYNISNILLLAFGLVGFTVFGVAAIGPKLLPGFDWQTAFVLGAVVATTDAIAATAIGRRLGLPERIMTVLEGESLVNDATGLLALELGLAMTLRGESLGVQAALTRLLYLVSLGVLFGFAVGFVAERLERFIEDGPVEIAISIIVPYTAYLGAESLHASGVLAVVTSGLYLSRKSAGFFSPQTRLQIYAVWNALTFLLNGFVFVVIGLQLPTVTGDVLRMGWGHALALGTMFSMVLIVLRLLWCYPGAFLATLIRRHVQKQNETLPPARQLFVVGWTGMRGVVALAAAVSLPATLPGGAPFPERSMIIFLTFSVILITVVVQGLSLPLLIKGLGLQSKDIGRSCEELEARQIILQAAIDRVNFLKKEDSAEFAGVYDDIGEHYRSRLFAVTGGAEDVNGITTDRLGRFKSIARELLDVERKTATRLRDQRRINDEVLRQIQYELDLSDSRLQLIEPGV